MTKSKIVNADNIAFIESDSVDSIVTDPPYGLGKEPNAMEVLRDWVEKGYHEVSNKGGFMGKVWDSFVPQPNAFREMYRVLKPGGYMLVACGTRTQDWMAMSIRLAGFEIRDVISWVYSQGFPKSLNISKAIDQLLGADREVISSGAAIKRMIPGADQEKTGSWIKDNGREYVPTITAPATDEKKQWEGWGTALKPATELWTLCRKPLAEDTVAKNVLKQGTGGINIDGCRIGNEIRTYSGSGRQQSKMYNHQKGDTGIGYMDGNSKDLTFQAQGRWPSNVIFSHHPDCKCVDSENNEETIEEWICVDGCPVKELNEQSGIRKSGAMTKKYEYTNSGFSEGKPTGSTKAIHSANQGYASRFYFVAKASRSERNKGLEMLNIKSSVGHNRFDKCGNCGGYIFQNKERPSACTCENPQRMDNEVSGNIHPTVKPVALMRYLVRMITPPGGTCVDPYNGSGTTGIACKLEAFDYIGVEQEELYCRISEARIAAWDEKDELSNQLDLFKNKT